MSTVGRTGKWIERSSDWANPILVKETRQALKSRQFVSTFMLLLVASWVITTFGMLSAGDAIEFGSTGRQFFYAYYTVLAIAIIIIVPFGAYRSLLSERDLNTYELLSITTLTPRQIVWGKLFSSMVQLFIYYSAIAPFIAFTSLLQGFDLAQVTFMLVALMLASLAASMMALMLSTMTKQRHWQALSSLVLLGGLVWLLSMFLTSVFWMLSSPICFDDPDFWWATGFVLIAGISYFILCQQITTAQLTFESDNRSTGIRITASVQFWLLWLCFGGYLWFTGSRLGRDVLIFTGVLSAIHWSAIGLFVATEDGFLSRRIRRGLPKSPFWRLIRAPFMPGSSRGFLYLFMHLAALWLVFVGGVVLWEYYRSGSLSGGMLWNSSHGKELRSMLQFATCLCGYVVIYLGIACAIGRWGRIVSGEIKPAHVRVLAVLVLLAGVIAPYIPSAMGLMRWRRYSLIHVTNPFESLWEVERDQGFGNVITLVVSAGALIAVVMNGRAMFRGVREVVFADVKVRRTSDASPVNGLAAPQREAQ